LVEHLFCKHNALNLNTQSVPLGAVWGGSRRQKLVEGNGFIPDWLGRKYRKLFCHNSSWGLGGGQGCKGLLWDTKGLL
jgi:hypothetical protein